MLTMLSLMYLDVQSLMTGGWSGSGYTSDLSKVLKIIQIFFSPVVIYCPRMSLDQCAKSSLQRVQIQIVLLHLHVNSTHCFSWPECMFRLAGRQSLSLSFNFNHERNLWGVCVFWINGAYTVLKAMCGPCAVGSKSLRPLVRMLLFWIFCYNIVSIKAFSTPKGKNKSLYCRCVEPVGYLKINKRMATRTLIHSRLEKSTKTSFFYFINCIKQKVQSACELKTDGHEQADVSAHCYLQCSNIVSINMTLSS